MVSEKNLVSTWVVKIVPHILNRVQRVLGTLHPSASSFIFSSDADVELVQGLFMIYRF
jgi:hypothetical protein